MPQRRRKRKILPRRPVKKSTPHLLLDQFSISDIRRWQSIKDEALRFHWDYYSGLAYQRSKIADSIKNALFAASERNFRFKNWQRTVKYKYVLEPFSVAGSLMDPGGRFNIGDIDPSKFSSFPAFYIASDKDTALQESLSQKIDAGQERRALDFALTNPASIASISLSGSLDSIINLSKPERLQMFVDLIKNFSIPNHLKEMARKLGFTGPYLIKTVPELIDSLAEPNWRIWPMQFDVPVASQIFGQLVAEAGVEGILYASKFTGKDCLVIFPQNFELTGSYIQLDDEAPVEIKSRRLDARIWNENNRDK